MVKMAGSKVIIGEDRVIRVNGQRFFPIAARHMPLGGSLDMLKEVGFNSIRWPAFSMEVKDVGWGMLPEDLKGLMFYPYIYVNGDLAEDRLAREIALTNLIVNIRDHPALLCYEQRNEPSYSYQNPSLPQSTPDGMKEGSLVIREKDPNHPIRVGHIVCNLKSTLRKYNPAVDIIGCNPYMFTPPNQRRFVGWRPDGLLLDSPNQTLSAVGDFTSKMMQVAEGRAVWMQLQAMANENWFNDDTHNPEYWGQGIYPHREIYPNRWVMRFWAFHSIKRGATGLSWAMFRTPVHHSAWKDISTVISELNDIHDILAAPSWSETLNCEYEEIGFSDWTGVETLVKDHEGYYWIIAVNTQFDPMIAQFSNLPKDCSTDLEVYSECRNILIKQKTFSDKFLPYETHIYRIKKSSSSKE